MLKLVKDLPTDTGYLYVVLDNIHWPRTAKLVRLETVHKLFQKHDPMRVLGVLSSPLEYQDEALDLLQVMRGRSIKYKLFKNLLEILLEASFDIKPKKDESLAQALFAEFYPKKWVKGERNRYIVKYSK